MALITRLTRLFRADMHAVLDRLEEPDIVLRQAVREMEEDVAQRARQLKSRELERSQAQTRMAEIEKSAKGIAAELDLCFKAGNEQLARTLLRRKLEGERLTSNLARRVSELGRMIAEQAATLEEQRRRLEAMRQRAAVFESEPHRADCSGGRGSDELAVTDADVDLALLREQQARGAS